MNSEILELRLRTLYGDHIILSSGANELELDLSEMDVPCKTKLINAQHFLALNKTAFQLFDKLFISSKIDELLAPEYLPNEKLSLLKSCDAAVFCTLNDQLIICLIEVKKTIGHKTYKQDIVPQLEFSFYKILLLLGLIQDVRIDEIPVIFIAIGSFREKDREMVDTAKLDADYSYNRFLRNGMIETKIPIVLKNVLHPNFSRKNVRFFHKDLNETIDLAEIMNINLKH